MSDIFYKITRTVGKFVFWMNSRPIVRGTNNVPRTGPCLVVATHQSPYDVPLLIRHTPRLLDFVSATDVFQNPIVATLYRSLNAFPLDRSHADPGTVRTIIRKLKGGRAVAMFPEGGVRSEADSVTTTRRMKPGLGRLANLANAPVVPCVIINSSVYSRPTRWMPNKRTRYGVIFGTPIAPTLLAGDIHSNVIDAFVSLHTSLVAEMARQR